MGTSLAYLVAQLDRQQVFPERLVQIGRKPVTGRAAGVACGGTPTTGLRR